MASETIFAYVGPKGSGKSHEGVCRLVDVIKAGRSVVAVIPDLRLDRVADLVELPLEDLRRWVRIVDYDDVEREDFWPDEHAVRHGSEHYRRDAWRESIVRSGDVVIIDEAWRWLESSRSIPPRFKRALHMARHWRGPADWRDPASVDRFLNADWAPADGGEEGDGTVLVSTNILLLTQDYQALDKNLRRQVDQVTELYSFPKGFFPPWVQRFVPGLRTDNRYNAVTFDSHRLPTKGTKAYTQYRSKEIHFHRPEIHHLMEKAGGQALETAIDGRRQLMSSAEAKHIKLMAIVVVLLIVVAGTKSVLWWRSLPGNGSSGEPTATASAAAPRAQATNSDIIQPVRSKSAGEAPAGHVRAIGTVGGVAVVYDGDRLIFRDEFLKGREGPTYVDSSGNVVSRYSARPNFGGRSGGSGVFGSGGE